MKYYYQATIQYDGTGYAGFQWQNNAPSIQDDFNQTLKKIVTVKITTMGASRTDSGVHAIEQVVKITSENPLDCSKIIVHFNQNLPMQIKCLSITPCSGAFQPASDTISKEYHYYFTNKKKVMENEREKYQRFVTNFSLELDMGLIQKCIKEIPGTHDFKNFCSAGSNVKSTIREISVCELTEIDPRATFSQSELFKLPDDLIKCYQLRIVGNGFLKQMIRHLVSCLWMVGSGKLTHEDFINLLNGPKKEKRLWKVAAPNGLFLYSIKYE